MKHMVFLAAGLSLLVSGCATPPWDVVSQTDIIDALMDGIYDDDLSCGHLPEQGDFGIGTFDNLAGELILLEGTLYQVRADGNVYRPDPALKAPFSTVCRFVPNLAFPVASGSNVAALEKQIDERAPKQNLFHAIRVTGHFTSIRTRSVPPPSKPNPPRKEEALHPPEFRMTNIAGIVVGFRCPPLCHGNQCPRISPAFSQPGPDPGRTYRELRDGRWNLRGGPSLPVFPPASAGELGFWHNRSFNKPHP